MNKDLQIFDLIAEERSRQMKGIELIASENFVSDQVGKRRLIVTGPSSDGIDNYKKVTKVYSELKVPNSGTENTEELR